MPLAIGAPAFIIAALFALLFLLGYKAFTPVIVRTVSVNIPVVGNVLGNLVAEGLDAVYIASLAFLDDLVLPAINLVLGPIAAIENTFDAVNHTLDQIAAAIAQIVAVQIPAAIENTTIFGSSFTDYIDRLVTAESYNLGQEINAQAANLTSQFDGLLTTAENYTDATANDLRSEFSSLGTDAATITALATAAADAAIIAAEAQIGNQIQLAYDDAAGYAQSLVTGLEGEITRGIATAEQFATTAITRGLGVITTDIDTAITGALSGIYTDIDTAVSDLVGVIGTTDADILAGVRAIPTSVPADIAGVATLAGATALTLTRYLKDCGIPNCQNLSQYGKDLQALLGLVNDASFLTFLVELVEHPSDAPAVVSDTFGAAIGATVAGFRSLVSV